MGRLIALPQHRFTRGEINPKLLGRYDTEMYSGALKKARNVLVTPQGSFRRRPGLSFIRAHEAALTEAVPSAATAPNGGTAANAYNGSFATGVVTTGAIGTTNPYVVVRYDLGSAKIIKHADVYGLSIDTGSSAEFRIQYSTDDAAWSNYGDALPTVDSDGTSRRRSVSPAVTARYWRVARVGATDLGAAVATLQEFRLWVDAATVSAGRIIRFRYSTTERYMVVLSDRTASIFKADVFQVSVAIPHTAAQLAGVDWVQSLDTLILFHKDVQPIKLFREGSDTEWGTYAIAFANIPLYDYGTGNEGIISDTRGWPQCGTFHEGRLWLGGLKSLPSTGIASTVTSFFDLDDTVADADHGFVWTLDADDVAEIFQIYSARHLLIYTSSGEYYVLPETDAITVENVVFKRTSEHGALGPGVRIMSVAGAVLFVQRNGATVREQIFTDLEQTYTAEDIALLSSHLLSDPVETALLRATGPEQGDLAIIVNGDGTLAVLQTLRSQQIVAWLLWQTAGTFLAAGADDDDLHVLVEREIDGVTVRFYEQFDFDALLDASVKKTSGLPDNEITGLDHLDGEASRVVADDIVLPNATPAAGTVTITNDASTYIEVGLDFPDVGDRSLGEGVVAEGLPLIPRIQGAPVLDQKKRIVSLTLQVNATQGFYVDCNGGTPREVSFRKFGDALLDVAAPIYTGAVSIDGFKGYSRLPTWRVTQRDPMPLEVLATEARISF